MDCHSSSLAFSSTGAFSRIAMDYVAQSDRLRPFHEHPTGREGILASIEARRKAPDHRDTLIRVLRSQYDGVEIPEAVQENIDALSKPNSFTITTAHQNNIFTGPLYFIYKILHVVRIAEELNTLYPADHFVPVYYMGSEDADLEELNHVRINGEKISWNTGQSGAVGRMKVDRPLLGMIDVIAGQLAASEDGRSVVNAIRKFYTEGQTIQQATFLLVNHLLGEYGVVVLIPDNKSLKQLMIPVFEDDLLHQSASGIVEQTAKELGDLYKVQAHPREINLFYLDEQVRERIEKDGENWIVRSIDKTFTRESLLAELHSNPERFSPNVILRGLYQETILPNIVFVGGGGELAYWLELKELFRNYHVPMPVLMLRNSFMVIGKRQAEIIIKLGYAPADIFQPAEQLLNRLVKKETGHNLSVHEQVDATNRLYAGLADQVRPIDPTLVKHVDALRTKALYRLVQLQKKMLRAEKRRYSDQSRQLNSLRDQLFPGGSLQERVDNILPFYARWGGAFIQALYKNSPGIDAAFVILECAETTDGNNA